MLAHCIASIPTNMSFPNSPESLQWYWWCQVPCDGVPSLWEQSPVEIFPRIGPDEAVGLIVLDDRPDAGWWVPVGHKPGDLPKLLVLEHLDLAFQ